jgi:hypothetical protein
MSAQQQEAVFKVLGSWENAQNRDDVGLNTKAIALLQESVEKDVPPEMLWSVRGVFADWILKAESASARNQGADLNFSFVLAGIKRDISALFVGQ